jgi:hypothetical protein
VAAKLGGADSPGRPAGVLYILHQFYGPTQNRYPAEKENLRAALHKLLMEFFTLLLLS